MIYANTAFQAIRGMATHHAKKVYNDIYGSVTGATPLSYAFRHTKDQAMYDNAVRNGTANQFKWSEGSLSYKKMGAIGLAGYGVANTGYRLLSGGSLYRDNEGNRNLIGLPLV